MEFYITNHCNLNCNNCNRFNNYNFRGHYDYKSYLDTYQEWAELLDPYRITIIGGEPLMHPDLEGWAKTIKELWPNAIRNISSNGTLLLKKPNLYNILKNYGFELTISVHNLKWMEPLLNDLDKFYPGDYSLTEDPDDKQLFAKTAIDDNNVKIVIYKFNNMHQSAVYVGKNSRLHVHNSNPTVAHAQCDGSTCHHMINGKLYKCGVEALIREFSNQFNLELTPEQRTIVESDVGVTIDQAKENLDNFVSRMNSPIPHCTLCPEKYIYQGIAAKIGKKKIPIISIN
jgi:organic radical activating enzyme